MSADLIKFEYRFCVCTSNVLNVRVIGICFMNCLSSSLFPPLSKMKLEMSHHRRATAAEQLAAQLATIRLHLDRLASSGVSRIRRVGLAAKAS